MNIRVAAWIVIIPSLFCCGCTKSQTETIRDTDINRSQPTTSDYPPETISFASGTAMPQLPRSDYHQDSVVMPTRLPIIENPALSNSQETITRNQLNDNEIKDIFDKIGRSDFTVNVNLLYACKASSIIPYLASENQRIKLRAIDVLGSIGDTATVMLLAEMMSDSNPYYSEQALMAIILSIRNQHLLVSNILSLNPHLVQYVRERSRSIEMAINLIGKTENLEYIALLKSIRERSRDRIARREGALPVETARYYSCLQAMAKLGDQESKQEIIAKLRSRDPVERGQAVQCIGYVGEELAPYLLPLIDDREPSLFAASVGSTVYYYRVCELVVKAIEEIYAPPNPFLRNDTARPTDQQLAEVKKWMIEHIARR